MEDHVDTPWRTLDPVKELPLRRMRAMFESGLVNLYTHDIEAGIRFYGELLGLEETFRTPKEGTPEHVEFRAGGFVVGLGTVEAAKRVHGVDATPGAASAVVVLWTNDVDAIYAELEAAAVATVQPPHDTGNSNRNALLRDPDGNLVELVGKRA
jgi:catechol 2,3-dioxygenase-like lactoylglutathione lyase family enzyme